MANWGLVEQHASEFFRASENYEQAVGLNPKSKIARYCFGMFLMTDMDDFEGALAQFEAAISLDPIAATVLTAKAMALTRLARLAEAAAIHEQLLPQISGRERRWRLTGVDQAADCYKRWAFQAWEKKEFETSKGYTLRALSIISEAALRGDFDEKLLQRVAKIVGEAVSKRDLTSDAEFVEGVIAHAEKISNTCGGKSIPIASEAAWVFKNTEFDAEQRNRLLELDRSTANREVVSAGTNPEIDALDPSRRIGGRVHNIAGGPYGFIRNDSGERLFFHANFLQNPADWALVVPGVAVSYKLGYNSKGPCATDVKISARGG